MNISNRLISTAARQRAAALLKELSLEEKVRQLGCTMLVSEDTDLTAKDLSGGIGEIALLDICEEPEALAVRLRDVQQYVMEPFAPPHSGALPLRSTGWAGSPAYRALPQLHRPGRHL